MNPITSEKNKLGFVGVGYMGRPIAQRLLQVGFKLTAYDRDRSKAEELTRFRMSGDIALYQGKPVVHTHMVVVTSDGTTRAGHVLDAYVSPTLEVMVTVDPVAMQKRFDPETDLTLIDPALK